MALDAALERDDPHGASALQAAGAQNVSRLVDASPLGTRLKSQPSGRTSVRPTSRHATSRKTCRVVGVRARSGKAAGFV